MYPSFRAMLLQSISLSACLLSSLCGCAKDPPRSSGLPVQAADASRPADTAAPVSGTVAISAAAETRKPRPNTGLGTSYWSWSPTYGNAVAGSEAQILPLAPFVVRAGGYNNDANFPDNFDEKQIDLAVAYAQAINADLILQVPLLAADNTGAPATAETAAAMVSYVNVTKKYGVKYFSIGNEPDLYPDAKAPTKGIEKYTAEAFCADAQAYVTAMKLVDDSIKIVGPDLSWKYQTGTNDWLTPILTNCGSLFDIVAIHRYPIDPTQTTILNAAADAPSLRAVIAHIRSILQTTGYPDKPLAITECNITWDGDPTKGTRPASPGTVPAGLWAADAFGVGLETGLWATVYWSIREGWTLGLLATIGGKPQPAYWAFDLYATHFGPTLVSVLATPPGVRAYASRNQADDGTQVIVVNWNNAEATLTFTVDGLATIPTPPTFVLPALAFGAVEIPDTSAASAWSYGETQHQALVAPEPLPAP